MQQILDIAHNNAFPRLKDLFIMELESLMKKNSELFHTERLVLCHVLLFLFNFEAFSDQGRKRNSRLRRV